MARYIDCDSHVEECEETWDYLDEQYQMRRPMIVTVEGDPQKLTQQNAYWLVDHKITPKTTGHGATLGGSPPTSRLAHGKQFSIGSQTLMKVEERLADMDRFGLEVQVIFPTVFLETMTDDVRFEANLMHSYNVWMSKRCAQSGGRLLFPALLPMRDAALAAQEVRAAKELGAVAVATYGTAGSHLLHSEHLDPVWQAAVEVDLPICVHTGWSHPGLTWSGTDIYAGQILGFTLPVLMAFHSFLGAGLLDRFPSLRVAFLEAGGDWLPYMVHRMDHYHDIDTQLGHGVRGKRKPSAYLKEGRVYLSVEGDEPLLRPVIERLGAQHVMVSADMPHSEARENAFQEIKERTDIAEKDKEWILGKAAEEFYRL
ncbi:MAG: amidohydrolase [Candidatus Tectomicrobia bacterium]|nr:amidohydrolase [Candidatus Tectomicrobia bacterium]